MKDAEKCPHCNSGTHGLDGEPKWCCYCGGKLDGTPTHVIANTICGPCEHQWAIFPRSKFDRTGIEMCSRCGKLK